MEYRVLRAATSITIYCLTACNGQVDQENRGTFTKNFLWDYHTVEISRSCGSEIRIGTCFYTDGNFAPTHTYQFFNYPNANCTMGVGTRHNCATGNFSSAALLFSIRKMGLLNTDSFKISTKSRDGRSQTVLAWFTKETTTCKENPKSCGLLLGEFSSIPINYTLTFQSSGGGGTVEAPKGSIWIDVMIVVQQTSDPCSVEQVGEFFACPALGGRVERLLMCESGDKVHCPTSYIPPASPQQLFVTPQVMQGYSWPLYPKYCDYKTYNGQLVLSTTRTPKVTSSTSSQTIIPGCPTSTTSTSTISSSTIMSSVQSTFTDTTPKVVAQVHIRCLQEGCGESSAVNRSCLDRSENVTENERYSYCSRTDTQSQCVSIFYPPGSDGMHTCEQVPTEQFVEGNATKCFKASRVNRTAYVCTCNTDRCNVHSYCEALSSLGYSNHSALSIVDKTEPAVAVEYDWTPVYIGSGVGGAALLALMTVCVLYRKQIWKKLKSWLNRFRFNGISVASD